MDHLHMYGKGATTPFLICPDTPEYRKFHMPKHRGEFAWVVKNDAGEVIDRYTPPRRK